MVHPMMVVVDSITTTIIDGSFVTSIISFDERNKDAFLRDDCQENNNGNEGMNDGRQQATTTIIINKLPTNRPTDRPTDTDNQPSLTNIEDQLSLQPTPENGDAANNQL